MPSWEMPKERAGSAPLGLPPVQRMTMIREGGGYYARIASAADVARLMTPMMKDWPDEHMMVIGLTTRHDVVCVVEATTGSVNSAQLSMQQIMRVPLLHNCPVIVCVHNHPSGDPEPSGDDLHLTRQIIEAGKIMTVKLLDHIIIGGDRGWTSLRERGMIAGW